MATYRLVTRWQIAAPQVAVYRAISQSRYWPLWWRGLVDVRELAAGNARGIGRGYRYHWQSRLGYRLVFDVYLVRHYAPKVIVGKVCGDLEGWGCWQLRERGGLTGVRHEWRVRTTRRWMNLAAPLARPLFIWSHHAVMRDGAAGLARWLNAPPCGSEW
ncbi:SRPBCC family protein [Oceanimonas pelagia]|uniref:SRPBCC family protein n=1 Tax=Oceanimonas pelagia TaxID=3028314 RepID=A0AA50QCW7_9GAMM|nr:SRPBCC family protein [Oceanimonas pelagia]WMC11692.1 SRPBCC family protein [Oceanimonas pelagia]